MGVRVKGHSFVAFERAIKELQGERAMRTVIDGVSPVVAQHVSSGEVLSVGWYPIEWYAALHAAAQASFGPAISREVGRQATRRDVTTVYRFILRFLSPHTLVSQMPRILGMVVDRGAVAIDTNDPGTASLRFSECEGASRGTWEDLLGSIETLLELCGGREPAARVVAGGGDGHAAMSCVLSWRAA
jgi:hypothetical protein